MYKSVILIKSVSALNGTDCNLRFNVMIKLGPHLHNRRITLANIVIIATTGYLH